ncbi:MAG TPA: Rnf-Nqr domain containing protein [Povalibacter sp.]|uniref:Rnf-Nqr domain containing protein n=1 Tax=Povalibacter sp. TaxID=1962978 RepID=UPI002B7CF9FF|nr:Rnf-Nqr domain containing protein [Povalibacter sp.]HMN43479.1 Rnf-Nqr domain containing protein [Povalibacter sp.]
MSALLLILLSAVLASHYAPALLGTRLFEETDEHSNSIGWALASFILIAVIAPAGYLIEHALLRPFDTAYLRTYVLVILVMILAPLLALLLPRLGPWTPVRPAFVLVAIGNPAVLATALMSADFADITTALWSGVGIGTAFAVMLLAFTALHARVTAARIPLAFRDTPIALVTTGLMALALMGLTGLIRD